MLVDATEGGGSPSEMAFALDTDQAVADFVVGLQSGLPDEVATAVEDLSAPGTTPYGAVVSTGCEPPRSVAIDAGEAGFQVVPGTAEEHRAVPRAGDVRRGLRRARRLSRLSGQGVGVVGGGVVGGVVGGTVGVGVGVGGRIGTTGGSSPW